MVYHHKKYCMGEATGATGALRQEIQLSEVNEEWNDDFYLSSRFLSLQHITFSERQTCFTDSTHKETDQVKRPNEKKVTTLQEILKLTVIFIPHGHWNGSWAKLELLMP